MQQSFCGKECEVQALGQTWRFGRWTLGVLDEWTDWARGQLPNPIDEAVKVIERMELDEQERKITNQRLLLTRNKIKDELVNAAMRRASSYLAFNSPEVQSLMNSPRGAARLVKLLLKTNHPDVSEEQALDLVMALGEDLQRIMLVTAGKSPPGEGNGQAPAASH